MTSNIANRAPFLKEQRDYPPEPEELSVEMTKSYNEIATSVNQRIIGVFPTIREAATGESWFIRSDRQQTIRKVFTFTSTTAIPHRINFNGVERLTRMWGTYTDGTNWYGLNAGTTEMVNGQITFYVDATNINFVVDTGTSPPALTSGTIVLEWLSPF